MLLTLLVALEASGEQFLVVIRRLDLGKKSGGCRPVLDEYLARSATGSSRFDVPQLNLGVVGNLAHTHTHTPHMLPESRLPTRPGRVSRPDQHCNSDTKTLKRACRTLAAIIPQ